MTTCAFCLHSHFRCRALGDRNGIETGGTNTLTRGSGCRTAGVRLKRGMRLLGLEMRDDLLAEKAKRMEHLLVLRRPDGAQQNGFLYAQRFVEFEKPDAARRRADAELRAFLAHLLGCGLAGMRSAGETLIARVITLVIGRHGGRVIVAPHQAGALALLP